ncbi:MAG: creatininase family protein [Clostridia bacterium]|nr:creatininase family protein [Clostridia bacterium]
MKKYYLSHMTWVEAEEAIKRDPVVLVPIGTTECQGRHLPLGYDHIVAQRLCEEAAVKCDAVIVPVIPYGESQKLWGFPGTVTISAETLSALLFDITDSLLKLGFTHIVFVNNHDPNKPPLDAALAKIRDKYGRVFPALWPTELARVFAKKYLDNPAEKLMHGNEPGTSLCMYLCPEWVRTDLIEGGRELNETVRLGELDFSPSGFGFMLNGLKTPYGIRLHDYCPQGCFGKAEGSAEIGKKVFDDMVDYLAALATKFRTVDNLLGQ